MAFNIGGKYDSSGYGYKNPLSTDSSSSSSSKGNWDWDGSSGSTDWKGGFKVDESGLWNKSFGRYNDPAESYLNLTKNKLFDTARRNRDDQDYDRRGSSGGQSGGGISAHSGEILPGFGVYESGRMAPVVLTPPQKGGGGFGQLGGMAGALGTGLGVFGPLGSLGGALAGGIADEIFG